MSTKIFLLVFFVRSIQLLFWGEFTDESEHMAIGWMLTQGERLYADIFSHHAPLNYLTTFFISLLSPTDSYWHFRLLPIFSYLLLGWSIVKAPLSLSSAAKWRWGSFFLMIVSLVMPSWYGHMVLSELYYGVFFLIFAVQLLLPIYFNQKISAKQAMVGGAALALFTSATLMAAFTFLISLCLVLFWGIRRSYKKEILWGVFAGILVLAIQAIWLSFCGDWNGFWRDYILFNTDIYSGFVSQSSSSLSVWDSFWQLLWLPALLFCYFKKRNWFVPLLISFVFMQTLKVRGFNFHAGPYYLSLCLLLSFIALQRKKIGIPVLIIAAIGLGGWKTFTQWPSEVMISQYKKDAIEYIKRNTAPGERIAVMPITPIIYLETKRLTAYPGVYYLPWMGERERVESRSPVCEMLKQRKPHFIWTARWDIWGYKWVDYGSCVDAFVAQNYEKVSGISYLFQIKGVEADKAL